MCGFLGSLGRPTHPAHPDGGIDIERALPWISRRGPDGHQAWRSADGRASLLHARLAIVDRDPRSDQPFLDVERRIAVAFAGEIYNFHQVRTELAKQHAFATESDTEVVLAAYAHDGIEGLGRLKGMYALAIVDEARRRVVLARDPIGKKPLYFARWNGQAYFGSSALPMVALHGASVGLDASLLGHYWEHGFVPPDRSLLPGMAPVAPGECLELDWESQLLKRHDCSPVPEVLYSGEPLGQVTTTISRLCHQAVQRRLENNNPTPTALLSGGIDSTVLVKHASALCANHHKSRHLKTLSLGALIPGTNDELYARYAAHRIGVRVTTLRLRAAGLVDSVVAALEHQDEPLGMPSYYFLHELVRASATHSRILLTGDGGDELFLGYRAPGEWVGTPEQRQTSKPTGTAEIGAALDVQESSGATGRTLDGALGSVRVEHGAGRSHAGQGRPSIGRAGGRDGGTRWATRYPQACELFITADCGGSNGYRTLDWDLRTLRARACHSSVVADARTGAVRTRPLRLRKRAQGIRRRDEDSSSDRIDSTVSGTTQ